jgi:hypothetical protein
MIKYLRSAFESSGQYRNKCELNKINLTHADQLANIRTVPYGSARENSKVSSPTNRISFKIVFTEVCSS